METLEICNGFGSVVDILFVAGNRMFKKEEKRSFGNGALRDKWENRAKSEADQCKQEAEWKEKSSLTV